MSDLPAPGESALPAPGVFCRRGGSGPGGIRASGFTYIELAVAVGVMLTLAALAVPALARVVTDSQLRASAAETASLLTAAKRRSVSSGEICRVDCPAGTGGCDMFCSPAGAETGNGKETPVRSIRMKRGTAAPLEKGDGPDFVFFPDGSAEGRGIFLSDGRNNGIAIEIFRATALPYIYEKEKDK